MRIMFNHQWFKTLSQRELTPVWVCCSCYWVTCR